MHRRMIQVIAVMTGLMWLLLMAETSSAGEVQTGLSVESASAGETFVQNTLRPSPSPSKPSPQAPRIFGAGGKSEAPNFIALKVRQMIDLQRHMVRGLGRYMANIKAGGGAAALWVGIGFAFLYGAVHAVGPGHGKMVVASFFVGREAKLWRGVVMGLQVAVTHVVAAVILVWLVDLSFRQFIGGSPAESLWIRMVSFGLITVIGLTLLSRALRNAVRATRHGIQHLHTHSHHHLHSDAHANPHSRDANLGYDYRQQGLLALVAGAVPCTGALLVMLFALANDIIGTGVILVAAISAGMAITMSAFGIISILFRRFVMSVMETDSRASAIAASILEHVGALMILLIGLSFFTATYAEWRL